METQKKKIILVVEDDEIINIAYKKALEDAGYETFFALTGDQGCNMAKQHRPNLILLDIMLQGQKNGFDVLQLLKSDDETKSIPVFVMTNLDSTHEKEALDMGATKFFVKASTSLTQIVEAINASI
ncbi:MAG: response regulator [Patescibacteria group bacterium]|nr:MAG: response regulator [Patescibacteria group bacterium]